jgi:UDP-N-acetylmuramoylalanine--D-glutamate ligase
LSQEQRTTDEARGPKVALRGKRVLVVGLARSGHAAARAFQQQGSVVTVSDLRPPAAFASVIPELLNARIGLELGLHRLETFLRQDLIVVSPGVSWELPELAAAREHKVRVVPEVEAASWFVKGRLVGITGSNGKTTTTTLLGRVLEASGFTTLVGGNIGVPLISLVDQADEHAICVAELSSFQLEAIQDLRVNVAVLLNLTPNHLDRHPSFEAYVAAKARIFRNQTEQDCAILNADDPAVMSLAPALHSRKVLFSSHQDLPDGLLVSNGKILYRVRDLERVLMDVTDVKLRGAFNLENVLAASAAACALGADFEALPRMVRNFTGVEHRLEHVRQIRGVEFYNDSKATSVDAAVKALSAFEQGVHLMLGGKDKGAPYAPLRPVLERRVRRLVLIGEAADRIAKELAGTVDILRAGDLETAVRGSFRAAVPGDTVLLAPACASFDQFRDFEHRGRAFKEIVERLAIEEHTSAHKAEAWSSSNVEVSGAESGDLPLERDVAPVRGAGPERREVSAGGGLPIPSEEVLATRQEGAPGATAPPEPHPEPRVLSCPEPVYVYEVAAQELAPGEGELWQEPPDETYEEFNLPGSLLSGGTESETLLYEVGAAAGVWHSSTGTVMKGGVTPPDSRAEASLSARPEPPGGEGSSAPGGSGSQGRLFEGSGN